MACFDPHGEHLQMIWHVLGDSWGLIRGCDKSLYGLTSQRATPYARPILVMLFFSSDQSKAAGGKPRFQHAEWLQNEALCQVLTAGHEF